MAKTEKLNLDIIIDTREQKRTEYPPLDYDEKEDRYYLFNTTIATLKTGDYSLAGLEDIFTIERKASTAEIAQNINEDRFEKEFERLAKYKYKYILCEFELRDVINYPIGSGIPEYLWKDIKIQGKYILKRITELSLDYNVPFIFAGDFAVEQAIAIFKKVHKNEQRRET